MLNLGFHASLADSSLFIFRHGKILVYHFFYVDDIVLTENNVSFLNALIKQLSQAFELKELGDLHYFLGLQITRTSKGLFLNRAKYSQDLLVKHNMLAFKPAKTPCVPNLRLVPNEGTLLPDPHPFRTFIGFLHYLAFTRPSLGFAVHQVCQFMFKPTGVHLIAAKHILRYLSGTIDYGIFLQLGPFSLSVFFNLDWAGDPYDRRSTTGFLVYLGYSLITWSAKKQLTISCSSTESEYSALASTVAKLCWLCQLLKDLGIFLSTPPKLWCDNVFALAIASNPIFHARTKHIEMDYHFIQDRVLRWDLQVKYIATDDQLADMFTKSLPTARFVFQRSKIMLPITPHDFEGG